MIHIPVRAERFFAQIDRGTSNCQAAVTSAGLKSTRQRHAGNVRSGHNAPDQKRKGSFREANTQNTTKETI